MVKYRKIPPAAATNQIVGNARIPPAADLQKNNMIYSNIKMFSLCLTFLCKMLFPFSNIKHFKTIALHVIL